WVKHDLDKPLMGQTYAERRRLDTLAVVAFTEATLETFSSSFSPQSWLRQQGLNAMQSMPALKHLLLKHAAGIAQLEG
ncbi:MAG: ubiquinone biosynthesis protein, partial [Ghiorsea sp.]|nr:ubiquinone biosynthesis protein [Ghiorsea sp.]